MAEGSETPRATSTDKLDIITKALRLLPDFDGNPNVLTRFVKLCDQLVAECVSRENQFNNLILINGILNKISGPAARLINSNGIPETGAGIRNALVNNFADQRDETSLYNDLALLTQGSSTPQEFYEKCQNLFSTIMTYISLHETVDTTIESKRDLYKKLTLQAFIRGLKDPLGYRIRCMRPETIEKALEFVHEEMNTLYMQQRNNHLPDKRNFIQQNQQHKFIHGPTLEPFANSAVKPFVIPVPGPSRPQFAQPQFLQKPQPTQASWKPNFNQAQRPQGPSRTQQMFAARPQNYNPQSNVFKLPNRNQPQPMSGVSHYVPKQLPVNQGQSGHRPGNPPATNYFRPREVNFNQCQEYYPFYNYSDFYDEEECYESYPYNYDTHCQYPEISYYDEAQVQYTEREHLEPSIFEPNGSSTSDNREDFPKERSSDKLK